MSSLVGDSPEGESPPLVLYLCTLNPYYPFPPPTLSSFSHSLSIPLRPLHLPSLPLPCPPPLLPSPLSVGSNVQYDFEEAAFKSLGAQVFTFDPTLSPSDTAFMQSIPYLHFEPLGLASKWQKPVLANTDPDKRFLTLQEMVNMTGRPFADIVKIDCEGCEYAVINELAELYTKNRAPPIKQLCVEFHR